MFSKRIFKSTGGIFAIALVLASAFGAMAFASSGSYSAGLPIMQGNVTIATGAKNSIGSWATVTSPTSIGVGKAWQWLDDSSGRASDSSLTYSGGNYYLGYYNTTSRGGISLRACTDGWTDPSYINGYVNFG